VLVCNVDDHLHNPGFFWFGNAGWRLSPVYDVNPVPTDTVSHPGDRHHPRRLWLLCEPGSGGGGVFGRSSAEAKAVVKAVAATIATWRDSAVRCGAKAAEITRM
jgi:serine/threonine-protein kinase HipA